MSGFTVWLTGLPGSGERTLALDIQARLQSTGFRVAVLDDRASLELSPDSRSDSNHWDLHLPRVIYVAHLLNNNGVVAIVAELFPKRTHRAHARRRLSRFCEVHVSCPAGVCHVRGRDAAPVQDVYEEPDRPDIRVSRDIPSQNSLADLVVARLREMGFLGPTGDEETVLQRLRSLGYLE